ncbi:MAG: nuclear transport factor 2 family protein [Acidimicrobiales bacterium]
MCALVAVVVAIAVVAAGCSSSSDDAADVLDDYLEVWNAEDAEAVMVFYADDAVLEGHPSDSDGLATGTTEVLAVETTIDGHQGSTGTMEFLNIEVSGDTVTYDNIFRNAEGECYSSAGTRTTVEDDKIVLMVWGETAADLC